MPVTYSSARTGEVSPAAMLHHWRWPLLTLLTGILLSLAGFAIMVNDNQQALEQDLKNKSELTARQVNLILRNRIGRCLDFAENLRTLGLASETYFQGLAELLLSGPLIKYTGVYPSADQLVPIREAGHLQPGSPLAGFLAELQKSAETVHLLAVPPDPVLSLRSQHPSRFQREASLLVGVKNRSEQSTLVVFELRLDAELWDMVAGLSERKTSLNFYLRQPGDGVVVSRNLSPLSEQNRSHLHPRESAPAYGILKVLLAYADSRPIDASKGVLEIVVAPDRSYLRNAADSVAWASLGVILAFSGLTSMFVFRSTSENLRIRAEVQRQTYALDNSRRKLDSLFENATDGIVVTDAALSITSVNRASEVLFGYPREKLLGHPVFELFSEADRTTLEGCFSAGGRTNWVQQEGRRPVFSGRRQDGAELQLELSTAELEQPEGTLYSIFLRDISIRAEMEERVRVYLRMLEQRNRDLNDFAYVASHDLKSPLKGIQELASWIAEDIGEDADPEILENLELMRGRIKRMQHLLNDLLTYSRAGALQTDIESVDIRELIQSTFSLQANAHLFELFLSGDLPTLDTIRTPLELVIRNLISNAIKHYDRPHGHIEISGQQRDEPGDKARWIFTVRDDGPGIDPKFHERIFGMFQTLKTRDETEGSGMGLALIKRIVEQYGGEIQVESPLKDDRGTAFAFTWPDAEQLRARIRKQSRYT